MDTTTLDGRQAPPTLRPYQQSVIDRVEAEVHAGRRRILLVAPTGAGKTVIAAALMRSTALSSKRGLLLVHRRELVHQTSQKFHAIGLDHGIVAAGFPMRPGELAQVGSISTLHARAIRSARMGLPTADLLIADEAHHAVAGSWRRIIEGYPDAVIVGLSATPCRGDGRGLGDMFQTMVECPGIPELIQNGHLVSTKVYAPTLPDLTGVRVVAGDYHEGQAAAVMDTPKLTGDIIGHWHRLAGRRRTACFATSVAHAVHLRDEFCCSGVAAEHLDGSTPPTERDAILARLASGVTEVVTNCAVLTEGWDCPSVSCIILAKPTRSLPLYRQIVGRGLRPDVGKTDCLILDHAGATLQHGLIDEPITWTLCPDRRAERSPHGGGGVNGSRTLATCPECTAVRWQGRPCTVCGWRPRPKAVAVDVADGELGEVDRDRTIRQHAPTAADKLSFYRQLLWIANERDYSPGWASHKHKEKFATWPATRFVTPIEPSPEIRSWVRSKLIAYAKGRAKAGAA